MEPLRRRNAITSAPDSDLPEKIDGSPVFSKEEVILTLHDENKQGRLFKTKTW